MTEAKKWTDDERSEAFERGLRTMEGIALELYRRGREPLLEELETMKRERDEARAALASCPDCAMYAERSARWHEDMQRAERERDEAREERDLARERFENAVQSATRYAIERDEARAEAASSLAMARIADEKHGWKCAEIDMLRGVGCMEDGDGPCGVCRKCAYRRGAEAMREACARWIPYILHTDCNPEEKMRAVPIPEEP